MTAAESGKTRSIRMHIVIARSETTKQTRFKGLLDCFGAKLLAMMIGVGLFGPTFPFMATVSLAVAMNGSDRA
ncbi:MAG TPA: hypothetical protein VEK34_05095 [Methylocella sp.]|nr:hypothetical protein [Methylocella sp.]